MLNWNRITDHGDYNQQRFELLTLLEGSTSTPYVDRVGDPTIGIGFNLVYNLEPVLRVIIGNKNWSDTLYARLDAQIDKSYSSGQNATLIANLDRVMADWHDNRDSDVPSTFRFRSDAQIAKALNLLAPKYDTYVDNWIADIPESSERAALFSLAWNGPSLLGPKLKAAVESGDRAEAWYEIRYNSNGIALAGIANRRYVEAGLFSLYDSDVKASYSEAVKAGQMLATHHQSVLAYEAIYDPLTAASIKGVETISTIVNELQPAITAVLEKFDLPAKRHVEEILAADTGIANISGDGTGYDTSKNDDDLLLGDRAANALSGGNGKDILIGLKGKDVLSGGSGADLFVFTTAMDSPASGGTDLVKDFQMGDQLVLRSTVELQLLEDRDADFTGAEGEIRWFWDGGKTMVEADYDGDRNADLAFALTGKVRLSEGDFLL
jgi:GH24 family phage-related lysozyme (muramidase)